MNQEQLQNVKTALELAGFNPMGFYYHAIRDNDENFAIEVIVPINGEIDGVVETLRASDFKVNWTGGNNLLVEWD